MLRDTFNVGDNVWEVRTSQHEFAVTECIVECIIECESNEDPERVRVKILTTEVSTITDGSRLYHNLDEAMLALSTSAISRSYQKG